jgi:hypothetical protein
LIGGKKTRLSNLQGQDSPSFTSKVFRIGKVTVKGLT